MTFVELFAGIGGFRLGLERAGMQCVYANEIEKACCEVYERHWPDGTMHRGDIREVKAADIPPHDLLTAGWPCQDLSVAGKRKGIHGERSGLFFEFVRLLAGTRTPWLLLENVPGLLSANEGRDFGTVLSELDHLGYGVAWRVLDARHFGVPQRRRRVYLVGHLGGPCPSEVLFEVQELAGVSAKDEQTENKVAGTLAGGSSRCHSDVSSGNQDQNVIFAYSVRCSGGRWLADGADNIITAPPDPGGVREASGLPGRLDVPVCECADGPRYRMLGNAVAVPVIEWIGRRLAEAMGRKL